MAFTDRSQHALIAVYGDTDTEAIAKAVALYLPDRDIKVLAPDTPEVLEAAAQNSVLTIIGFSSATDPNLRLARTLQNNRMIVGDIVACALSDDCGARMKIMGMGFDGCITLEETQMMEFKKYLAHKISNGARRLDGLILEEEYRRLNDALSIAPVSLIVFDSDKRAVFVSDHYFRAYPKIAPRLIRGLRVYDAFDLMTQEEGLEKDDERFELTQRFWHNLEGNIQFTLDNGTTYRLKAIPLPNSRGTAVIGQNLTKFIQDTSKAQKS